MKKTIALVAMCCLSTFANSQSNTITKVSIHQSNVNQTNSDKGLAIVNQVYGVSVFIYSKPASKYDYLGSIEKLMLADKPEYTIESMIEKMKKKYPDANGIIFSNLKFDQADAVKIQ